MHLFRLCIADVDAADLELALGYALSTWIGQLNNGDRRLWEQFAQIGHGIRNAIASTPPENGCRWLVLVSDVAGTLFAAAETCDAGPPAFARLTPILRVYAHKASVLQSGERSRTP